MATDIRAHVGDYLEAFRAGANISDLARRLEGTDGNTTQIIELAYDLQTGTYLDAIATRRSQWQAYASELADHISGHGESYLEVGTGEATTLCPVMNRVRPRGSVFAFDISWSRVAFARAHVFEALQYEYGLQTELFVGDLFRIPLADASIDVVFSSHALEPNGGKEAEAVAELLRVASRRVFLFEPCYERATSAGQERMTRHGYVRDLPGAIEAAGGRLLSVSPITNVANHLNPTFCFEVAPPARPKGQGFVCPWAKTVLERFESAYWSRDSQLAYPVIGGIPVLRRDAALIATHFGSLCASR